MDNGSSEAARQALRHRLGAGARYDADNAPARELAWARLGTSYFARKLNELTDDALDNAASLPGWTRRRVIASVGYQARMLALQVEAARNGAGYLAPGAQERARQVDLGATLPTRALRNLFDHAAVHLNVEWRDLTDESWTLSLHIDGTDMPVRNTAWQRARAIWVQAVDLNNGGSFSDFPPDLLDALLVEATANWSRDGAPAIALIASDRPTPIATKASDVLYVRGAMADLVRWIVGRGARRLTSSADALPFIPEWT